MRPGDADTCPLCNQSCVSSFFVHREGGEEFPCYWFNCNRCGWFLMPKRVTLMFKAGIDDAHLLSGFVRETNERGDDRFLITEKNIPELKKLAPRGVMGQAARLLRAIAHRSTRPGESVSLDMPVNYPLAYCAAPGELLYFVKGDYPLTASNPRSSLLACPTLSTIFSGSTRTMMPVCRSSSRCASPVPDVRSVER